MVGFKVRPAVYCKMYWKGIAFAKQFLLPRGQPPWQSDVITCLVVGAYVLYHKRHPTPSRMLAIMRSLILNRDCTYLPAPLGHRKRALFIHRREILTGCGTILNLQLTYWRTRKHREHLFPFSLLLHGQEFPADCALKQLHGLTRNLCAYTLYNV